VEKFAHTVINLTICIMQFFSSSYTNSLPMDIIMVY